MRRLFRPAMAALVVGMAIYGYSCFYYEPKVPTYHLMEDRSWYKLDTRGIDVVGSQP